ncbi:PRCP [Symbiodinium pilosum]|uniref:PRCP protein n=1 Tax=Symbiodinium pilosum TaxID=2952 RepID=A0A812JLS8_SYMPI|nr:PRCP [Symbiodinium pilosum]
MVTFVVRGQTYSEQVPRRALTEEVSPVLLAMVEERDDDDNLKRGEQDAQGRYVLEGPTNSKAFALLVRALRRYPELSKAMVSGLILGAVIAGIYNWVYSYNRDAWMTDIQVEQAHHYQKDNLQIQMHSMRRDEVRDLVNSDINRINSSLLVATLILSLAGEMLFEGQIPTDCPPFVLNAYMLCLGSAVFYLTLSILSGIIASNSAYHKAARLLVHYIRPRWKEHFQQLRQRQAHENTACFESKPIGSMMMPPLAGRMWRAFRQKEAGSPAEKTPRVVHSLSERPKKVERYYSFEESSPGGSATKTVPSTRGRWSAETRSMGIDEAEYADSEADSEDELRNLERAKRKSPVQWYVMFWHDPKHEWQKCCNCMFKCVARGTTNLVEACGYLAVGTLYGGYAEAWAFWAVQVLFSVINIMVIGFLLSKFESRTPDRDPSSGGGSGGLIHGLLIHRPFVVASIVASGPLWCVIAAATSLEMLDRFLIPTCYATHTVVNMFLVWWLDHDEQNQPVSLAEEEEDSSEDQLELGAGSPRRRRPSRPKDMGVTGVMAGSMLAYGTMVISAFWCLALLWALHGAFYGMDFKNSKAAVEMWDTGPPLLEVSSMKMASPSPFWSPHALVCPRNQVFIADRYRVYEMSHNNSKVTVYPCPINGTIADISATCDDTVCWPIILVHGTPSMVVDCNSKISSPLLQSSGEARRIATSRHADAKRGGALQTLIATLQDKVILEYGWSIERSGWQPLWDIQETVGVLALDLVEDRLLIFYRGGFLQAKDIRTGDDCGRWALPNAQTVIGGGCGNKETNSMLVLAKLRRGGQATQLLRAELPSLKVLDLSQLGICRSEMIMERINLAGLRIKNWRLENSHVKKIEISRCDLLDCDLSFTVTAGEVKVSSSRLENVQFGVFTMVASVEESQLVRCNLRVAEELFVADSELDSCTFKGSDEDRKDRQFISAIFNHSDLRGASVEDAFACVSAPDVLLTLIAFLAGSESTSLWPQRERWIFLTAAAAKACGFFESCSCPLAVGGAETSPAESAENLLELPLMPLPAVLPVRVSGDCHGYLPSPSQQLMISEPRYLQLYDDILLNGSRMFVVAHRHDNLLARVGLIFHLKNLKDVSTDTHGHVKYAADHEVRGRVRILSVRNPEEWTSQSSYLRAQVQLIDPLDQKNMSDAMNKDISPSLMRIRQKLQDSLALQGELQQQEPEELGRLARSLRLASVIRNPGFWDMCSMLASVQSFRLQLNIRRMRENVKRLTSEWAEQNPEGLEALKKQPEVLPAHIRREGEQVREMLLDGTVQLQGTFQRILQALDVQEQADLMESAVDQELRRMHALRTLKDALDRSPGQDAPADITLPFDRVVCERTYFHGRLLRMTKGGSTISLRRAKLRMLPRIECEGKILLCLEDCDLLEPVTFQGMRLQLRGVHCTKPCEFREVEFATKVCDIVFPRSSRFVNVRFKDGLQACVASACRFEYCNLGYGQDAVADCLLTQCHFQSCHFPFLEDCSPVANFAGSQFNACRIQWSGPFAHEESFVINSHWLRKWNLASCSVSDTAV